MAFYSGDDFVFMSGGSFRSLDPEGKVRELLSRKSVNTDEVHGVYIFDGRAELLQWWMGLDGALKYATCVVFDPKTGNFWLANHKDANCSAVIRDANNKQYVITGTTKDEGHNVKAFTFLHGFDYKNDGASWDMTKTKQGIIASVGAATTTAGYLTCGIFGNTLANLKLVTAGYCSVTIDDVSYNIGPINFSGAADLAACAALIQTAIRAKTGATETCAYSTNKFVITSSTTTNRSNVSYLRPYVPSSSATNISGKNYLNGESGHATKTEAVTQRTLTLYTMASGTPDLSVDGDGEVGCYVYICNATGQYGQYCLVSANTATTITITPDPYDTPAAGWLWFLGGIVPTWTKWFDFGSPQHRSHVRGVAITVAPGEGTSGNTLFLHGLQNLSATVRTARTLALGGTMDTTNVLNPSDKPANQHGISIKRPSSSHGLKIEDITIVHEPRV